MKQERQKLQRQEQEEYEKEWQQKQRRLHLQRRAAFEVEGPWTKAMAVAATSATATVTATAEPAAAANVGGGGEEAGAVGPAQGKAVAAGIVQGQSDAVGCRRRRCRPRDGSFSTIFVLPPKFQQQQQQQAGQQAGQSDEEEDEKQGPSSSSPPPPPPQQPSQPQEQDKAQDLQQQVEERQKQEKEQEQQYCGLLVEPQLCLQYCSKNQHVTEYSMLDFYRANSHARTVAALVATCPEACREEDGEEKEKKEIQDTMEVLVKKTEEALKEMEKADEEEQKDEHKDDEKKEAGQNERQLQVQVPVQADGNPAATATATSYLPCPSPRLRAAGSSRERYPAVATVVQAIALARYTRRRAAVERGDIDAATGGGGWGVPADDHGYDRYDAGQQFEHQCEPGDFSAGQVKATLAAYAARNAQAEGQYQAQLKTSTALPQVADSSQNFETDSSMLRSGGSEAVDSAQMSSGYDQPEGNAWITGSHSTHRVPIHSNSVVSAGTINFCRCAIRSVFPVTRLRLTKCPCCPQHDAALAGAVSHSVYRVDCGRVLD